MILICGATQNEVAGVVFDEIFHEYNESDWGYVHGRIGKDFVIKSFLGIGKINATLNLTRLVMDFSPDAILFVGLAGTFSGKSGYFYPSQLIEYDYDLTPLGDSRGSVSLVPLRINPQYVELCKKFHIVNGVFGTGDRFLTNKNNSDVVDYLTECKVDVIDMESYAVQKVFNSLNLNGLIVRYISDNTQEDNNSDSYNEAVKTDPFKNIIEDFISLNSIVME